VLLLREADLRLGVTERLAGCFTDYHRKEFIEHDVLALLRQKIYAVALGYAGRNNHDENSP